MPIDPLSGVDAGFYLWLYPDVAAAGVDPIAHFITHGDREGRRPNALFDPDFYPAQLAPGDDLSAGVFAHYRSIGAGLGLDPHPLFDSAFYAAQIGGALPLGGDPLTDFLSRPAGGPSPLAWFDTSFYLATNPDVATAGVNPLAHYATSGHREGRDPHPLFDLDHYLASNADVAAAEVDPLAHFLRHGFREGRTPHALFDAAHYLAANPDVAAAGVDPVAHYAEHGWREGRTHHPLFDPAFYLATNPDVAAAGVDAFIHYMVHGWREGRDPSAAFDLDFYALANPDVAAAGWNLLVHYARFGQAEGRAFAPGQIGHDGRLRGTQGDDGALIGDGRNNLIEGFDGADVMAGGDGADTIVGGAGPDTIVVAHFGAGLDVAVGFDPTEGDVLDLRPALDAAGYDPDVAPLADFVRVRQDGGDTIVDLLPPGAPGGGFAPAIRLQGVALDFPYLRYFGLLVDPAVADYQLVDDPYGFTDTFDTTSDVAITPDGRFVVWTDLHDFDDVPEFPGEVGFNLVKHANIATSGPADDQADRQQPVSVDANGDAVTGSILASVSDDGRVVGYTHRIGSGSFERTFWTRDIADPDAQPEIAARNAAGAAVAAQLGKLSAEGTHAVFVTDAGGMGGGLDFNGAHDVYLRDLATGRNTLVSVAANGFAGGSGYTLGHEMHAPDLSAGGRWVVFASDAALTADDMDGDRDVYLRDTVLGVTTLLSGGESPGGGGGDAGQPTISADGSVVAFTTEAALDENDGNAINDVYVVRLQAGTMVERFRLSEARDGGEGADRGLVDHFGFGQAAGLRAGESYAPEVSPDGTAVAFVTRATEIVPVDGAAEARLVVRDLETGDYGAPQRALFTSFSDEETQTIRSVKHGLTESGDGIIYRVLEDGEDTPLVADVAPLPTPADVSGFSGLTIAPRDTWDGDDGEVMFVFRTDLSSGSDRDRFRIDPSSGFYDPDRLRITLEGDDRWGDGLADPRLTVRDARGAILAQNDDVSASNPDSRITLSPDDAPGGLLIDVEGAGSGDYTLRIEALGPFVIGVSPIFVGRTPIEPRLPLEPVFSIEPLLIAADLFT